MEIVSVKDVETSKNTDAIMKTIFKKEGGTQFGTVVVPPGVRIPMAGTSAHSSDEYSIVLKGSILVGIEGKEYEISGGQATLIPAGEAHYSINNGSEDCEIVWVLV